MTVRPILFSEPMVRALLSGAKTQTRRGLKPQPEPFLHDDGSECSVEALQVEGESRPRVALGRVITRQEIPYSVGDLLWVRETWAHYHTVNHIRRMHGGAFSEVSDGLAGYRADGHDTIEDFRDHVRLMSGLDLEAVLINGGRWRPSIHMPRWASRLTLAVTDVRVQRLWKISETDALAEGICIDETLPEDVHRCWLDLDPRTNGADWITSWDAKDVYRQLWHHLHGPGAWETNPWVVAVSFDVHRCNVDALPRQAGAAS